MANKLLAALNDTTLFLQEWFANPQRTGAVAPSSPKLAAAMARWLPSDPESYVLELGPGTGAVTQALLGRGLREERLVAIEHNPKLAGLLRKRFPSAEIITGDAWQMDELLRDRPEPIDSVGAVISSLPLLNFPPAQADALAGKIRAILTCGGKWVQYSYHLGIRRQKCAASFRHLASKIVWLNLPPARVNVYQK
ncbi:MAG: methyltransferase domain-containing protein [Verrucomicrobiota bacterium]|jgi:phosphatidylethanolamine/phosphatidyl-N-methylethanolamine N-methyltransferase